MYICVFKIPCNTEILLVQVSLENVCTRTDTHQNPPSIPTLLLAQIISNTTRTKLIIDWHNTGYSILAMRLGESSPIVRIAKW
jgi:beta-1,4-mannosyltransferase